MINGMQLSGYQNVSGNFSDSVDKNSVNAAQKKADDQAVVLNPGASTEKAAGRKSSPAECQTCKNRKYQDGSNEMDVSFKTPAHISPGNALAEVSSHEHEHVANAYEKASKAGGKVEEASVQIFTDICPECGRVYVSGGVTHTRISYPSETQSKDPAQDLSKIFGDEDPDEIFEADEDDETTTTAS